MSKNTIFNHLLKWQIVSGWKEFFYFFIFKYYLNTMRYLLSYKILNENKNHANVVSSCKVISGHLS